MVVVAAHKYVGAVCQSGRHKRRSGAVRDRRSRCHIAIEVSRRVAKGTVLSPVSLAHEIQNLPEPSVALPYTSSAVDTQYLL